MPIILAFIILLVSNPSLRAQEVGQTNLSSGEELITLTHKTYSHNWYNHLTFKQNIFLYKGDSLMRNEIWEVAYSCPTRLHVRYNNFESGRGWLLVNDTLFSYNHNKLIGKKYRLHEQIILAFDIYTVDPSIIIQKVKDLDINLAILNETMAKGDSVYQIGDPMKHCFWVRKNDLLLLGIRKVTEHGISETYFENYKLFYGKPVATELQYFQNGSLYRVEKYFEIRLPTSFPDIFFKPDLFESTRW